jgi:small-conductance mechanosensitive channel/CRP-like cAMP-binding protein
MKSRRIPLFIRRIGGPLAILLFAFILVWALTALGLLPGDRRTQFGGFAIGIACVLVVMRLIQYLIFDLAFQLHRNLVAPALLRQLVGLLIFGIGLGLVAKMLFPGWNLGALLTTSAILTAVIGLALQDTLGNLFVGLAMHLEKTVQVGDMVRSGETFGTVEELSWRAMKLRTTEGNLLLIPNSVAGRERLEIFPRPGRPIARFLRVGLEDDASPAQVLETLVSAVRQLPGLARFPEPVAYLKAFADYSITYELRYWLEDYARYLEIDSQVRERVWYALDRAGMKLAYPVVRQHQYAAGPLSRPSRRDQVVAALGGVDIFAALTPEDRQRLAEGARERRYAAGEVVVNEGDRTCSMFVIESGRAGVTVHPSPGDSRRLAVLEPGSAFGEISLLTGEPRTATVRTLTETVLIEIDKPTLGPILERTPALCEVLETIMQERRRGATDLVEATRAQALQPEPEIPLAERIARFFGLRVRA